MKVETWMKNKVPKLEESQNYLNTICDWRTFDLDIRLCAKSRSPRIDE